MLTVASQTLSRHQRQINAAGRLLECPQKSAKLRMTSVLESLFAWLSDLIGEAIW
jgi:hypothetical protein